MQVSISVLISGCNTALGYVRNLIKSFKARVSSYPNSIFEAEACLSASLKELNTIGLLDNASLVITPNAYEESVLYSVVPNTTLGDMDVVRATTATRVNSAGLIEVVPRNLLTYSEQFDDATWTKSSINIIANDTIAPNGIINADKATLSTASGRLSKSVALLSDTQFTLSTFIKNINATNSKVRMLVINNANTVCTSSFILTESGSIVEQGNATGTITSYNNGWYRCTITFNSETGITTPNIRVLSAAVGGFTTSESVFIWGAQLELGSTATEYFPTTTRLNIPRIDYTNGSCPSLLVEPQRTNLISNANGYAGNFVYYTVTPNQSSPDGLNNAVLFVEKTSTSAYSINSINASILPNTQYTYSFFVKYAGIQFIPINATDGVSGFVATFDALNGIITSGIASVQQYTDDWYRVSLTRTSGATANTATIQHGFGTKTGDGVSGFYLFGNQIEQGSNPTSYIPTVASTVTRNADVISKTGISSLIGQTEGTIFVDFNNTKTDSVSRYIYAISNGNLTTFNFEAIITNSNELLISSRNNGDTQVSYNYGVVSLQKYKIAYSYSENNTRIFINGLLVFIDTLCTIPTADSVKLGMRSNNATPLNDSINQLLLFKTQLNDAECIALTTL